MSDDKFRGEKVRQRSTKKFLAINSNVLNQTSLFPGSFQASIHPKYLDRNSYEVDK